MRHHKPNQCNRCGATMTRESCADSVADKVAATRTAAPKYRVGQRVVFRRGRDRFVEAKIIAVREDALVVERNDGKRIEQPASRCSRVP